MADFYPSFFSVSRFVWLAALLVVNSLRAGAQATASAPLLPAYFLPKSPTVSELPRFDKQQLVSLSTGASQFAVPLVEISSGALHVPVTLAYSYSGMKVYQPKDLVGVGWELQAGAAISLQVNGRLDSRSTTTSIKYNRDSVETASQAFLKRVANNQVDAGPDVYSFTIPGGPAGRFIIQDTTVVLLPQQPVHIRWLYNQPGGGKFLVTTEEGTRYLFGAVEWRIPGGQFAMQGHAFTWHLSSIISAGNTDTIQFHYQTRQAETAPNRCALTQGSYHSGYDITNATIDVSNPENASFIQMVAPCIFSNAVDYSYQNVFSSDNSLRPQYLDSITTRGARVLFAWDSAQILKSVRLVTTVGERRQVKAYMLYQSPFLGTPLAEHRIRLDSVREGTANCWLPAYRFKYNEDQLIPSRSSSAVDYWGYSNGARLNGSIDSPQANALLPDPLLGANMANREPDFNFALAGALERVIYPTGGQTRWEYESGQMWYPPGTGPASPNDSIDVDRTRANYDAQNPRNILVDSIAHRYVTPSDTTHFLVPADGGIVVYLSRQTYPSPSGQGKLNLYTDFNIWRCLPTGDTLITNLRPYKVPSEADGANFTFQLPAGTYAIQVYCEKLESVVDARLRIYDGRYVLQQGHDLPECGIRVKRTRTLSAGAPPLVRQYAYTLPDSLGGHGAGIRLAGGRGFTAREYRDVFFGGLVCILTNTSSDNSLPGEEFRKYAYYYRCVSVRDSAGTSQGVTVNFFDTLPAAFYDVVLTQQLVFQSDAQQRLRLVQQEDHQFFVDSSAYYPFLRAWISQHLTFGSGPGMTGTQSILTEKYGNARGVILAAFTAPSYTRRTLYDEQGRAHSTCVRSYYQHQRLVRTTSQTSTGWAIERIKRLSDYAALPALATLRTRYFNPVLETQRWYRPTDSRDSVLTGATLTLYDPTWWQPASSYRLALARPQAAPDQETTSNGQYTTLLSDSRYERQVSIQYGPGGEPLAQRPAHGPTTSYLTGYDRTLTIAQVQNAPYEQIAYTSFEPASTGRWLYDSTGTHRQLGGRTGSWAFRAEGSSGVVRPNLPAGAYELLWWQQGAAPLLVRFNNALVTTPQQVVATAPGDWRQVRLRFQTPGTGTLGVGADVSGSVLLDEVRLHPVGARMTSFTHAPLVGETSQTGPDGRTLTYEYDALGRLVRTRDEQGRILGQQQYHYAGQP